MKAFYHEGELGVQARAGVQEMASRVGRSLRSGTSERDCACSRVSQLAVRHPFCLTPLTAVMPLASCGSIAWLSAASRASLRIAKRRWLISALESPATCNSAAYRWTVALLS